MSLSNVGCYQNRREFHTSEAVQKKGIGRPVLHLFRARPINLQHRINVSPVRVELESVVGSPAGALESLRQRGHTNAYRTAWPDGWMDERTNSHQAVSSRVH